MFRKFLTVIEDSADSLGESFQKLTGQSKPIIIKPYAGYGNAESARIRGRVLARQDIPAPGASDSEWRNMANMTKRWLTDEVPGAQVQAKFRGETLETVTDEEGYFLFDFLEPVTDLDGELWQDVEFSLLSSPTRLPVTATGSIQVPSASSDYGIISDIDDTVIHTGATSFLKMVRTTLAGNATTRTVFEGVSDLYAALRGGKSRSSQNPFFYVTSSPWNLYDLVGEIFDRNAIPKGAPFMKDWGLDEAKFITTGHQEHKLAAIREVLDFFPDKSFILIGDSGQEDPEIYAKILDEYPQRILAAYIRDVTTDVRDEAVRKLARAARESSAELVLTEDSDAARTHAREAGFIAD